MNRPRFLMCPPPHFGVFYVINPWMEGQIAATSVAAAEEQWNRLRDILAATGDVELIPPVDGLPDLVFTANAALIWGRRAVLSSFRYPERQGEEEHFARWLTAAGFDVQLLPRSVAFEGAGDALLDRSEPLLWLGHGVRSDLASATYIRALLDVEIQPLELCESRFYHLDTCFCPLEGGRLLYYPAAFRPASVDAIERRIPADLRFAVSDEDAGHFACNAVNIGETVVLNRAGSELRHWLGAQGFDVVETPMTEFMKAGGAAKCLSLRLDEDTGAARGSDRHAQPLLSRN